LIAFFAFHNVNAEQLSLKQALDYAFQNNKKLQLIQEAKSLDSLVFKYKELALFLPDVTLTSSLSNSKTLVQMPARDSESTVTVADKINRDNFNTKASIALEVSPKPLYDFGLSDNAQIKLEKELANKNIIYSNQERDLIFQVIDQYYDFVLQKEKLDVVRRKKDISTSIFMLIKQKNKMKRATDEDVAYARREVISTQKAEVSAESYYKISMMKLLNYIYLPIDRVISPRDELKFTRFNIEEQELLKKVLSLPSVKTLNNEMEIAKIDFDKINKDLTPLPKLKISGYKLGKDYSDKNTYNNNFYGTTNSNKSNNFDVRVEASVTIPLWSDAGFWGQVTREQSKFAVHSKTIEFEEMQREAALQIRSLVNRFQVAEMEIISNKDQLDMSSTILDGLINRLQKGDVDRSELKDANTQLTDNNLNYITSLKDYINLKIEIAKLLGDEKLLGLISEGSNRK
jgi:outer membrane protein TolC